MHSTHMYRRVSRWDCKKAKNTEVSQSDLATAFMEGIAHDGEIGQVEQDNHEAYQEAQTNKISDMNPGTCVVTLAPLWCWG